MTEQQLARMAKRRLAILGHAEEITGSVSQTCRYYGISRQCFSTWRRRYDTHASMGSWRRRRHLSAKLAASGERPREGFGEGGRDDG